jgi:hypothetical protein
MLAVYHKICWVERSPRRLLNALEPRWNRDKIEETLVCFSRSDPVHAHFQRGLEQLGVEWFCGIEVTSERLIQHYVASGYGIGLTVAVPGFKPLPQLRALPLPNSPPVAVGRCVVRQTFKYHAPTPCRARR